MYTMENALAKARKYNQDNMEAVVQRGYRERKNIETTYQFVQEAQSIGLNLESPESYCDTVSPTFTLEKEQFRLVHQLVGSLKQERQTPADEDARKRLVWQYLVPTDEHYKHITFRYKRQLPKTAKCKVKRVRQKAYYTTEVVCEV